MAPPDAEPPAAASAVMLRDGAATLIEAVATRLELAATELAEEGARILRQNVLAVVGLLLSALGVALTLALAVLVAPPAARPAVLGAEAAICLVLGGIGLWRCRSVIRSRPPLLDATLHVLRDDAQAWRPHPPTPTAMTPRPVADAQGLAAQRQLLVLLATAQRLRIAGALQGTPSHDAAGAKAARLVARVLGVLVVPRIARRWPVIGTVLAMVLAFVGRSA